LVANWCPQFEGFRNIKGRATTACYNIITSRESRSLVIKVLAGMEMVILGILLLHKVNKNCLHGSYNLMH